MYINHKFITITILAIVINLPMIGKLQAKELLVYSTRNASYLSPLFDRYSAETGTAIRYIVSDTKSLLRRMESEEGEASADLFITTGILNLSLASQKGLLANLNSKTLNKNIPDFLRASEQDWFAFATRTEAIVYASDRVDEEALSTYEALGDKKWRGKLCLRSSRTEYTQSLLTGLTQRYGEPKVRKMVKLWLQNLSVNPITDDLEIITAVDKKVCDVAFINSYYLPRYLRDNPHAKLKLFWPDQNLAGSQFDITGAAVIETSTKKETAVDFLEWLSSKEAQTVYARVSMEHPVHRRVYPARGIAKYGKFKLDKRPIESIVAHQSIAFNIAKKARYK